MTRRRPGGDAARADRRDGYDALDLHRILNREPKLRLGDHRVGIVDLLYIVPRVGAAAVFNLSTAPQTTWGEQEGLLRSVVQRANLSLSTFPTYSNHAFAYIVREESCARRCRRAWHPQEDDDLPRLFRQCAFHTHQVSKHSLAPG